MFPIWPGLRLLALAAVLVGSLTLLAGCGRSTEDPGPGSGSGSGSPPAPAPTGRREVEFDKTGKADWRLKIHVYAGDGVTKIETQTEYRDGRMLYQYYRADGTLKEQKETYSGGKTVKQRSLYAADGRTVVEEEKFRQDGTLESDFRSLPDGTRQTRQFRADGKRLYSVELTGADRTSEKTYYRKDGVTLWAVFRNAASAPSQVDYYGVSGTLEHRRVYRSDNGMDITVYRADGTVSHKQSWRQRYGGWWYRSYALEWSEEFDATGTKPVRRLVFDASSYNTVLTEAHRYNADGSKASIRYFRSDGTLEKEEFLDSSGKVTKTEEHKAEEGIREVVDPGLSKEPAFDDPSDPYKPRD